MGLLIFSHVAIISAVELHDGRRFGLPEGTVVGPGGVVYDQGGRHIGHLDGWDEKLAQLAPQVQEEEGLVFCLCCVDCCCAENLFEGAEYEDGKVKVKGQVVGTVDDDGLVIDLNGKPLGRIAGVLVLCVVASVASVACVALFTCSL